MAKDKTAGRRTVSTEGFGPMRAFGFDAPMCVECGYTLTADVPHSCPPEPLKGYKRPADALYLEPFSITDVGSGAEGTTT